MEQNDETKVYSTIPQSNVNGKSNEIQSNPVKSSFALDKAKSFYEMVSPVGSIVK